ncbi:MAG: hypothetical protein A7315_03585 [Candidatus Altiarchaeales archaeon WOR_SM1_79]|nr:MAG: hypothetical protein A7315_03585 [Candidatus Altiarchaeales archaeon WOR_SM1_79]
MKIGRNDPCPCGSGKKYKKCCMGKNGIGRTITNKENPGATFEYAVTWILTNPELNNEFEKLVKKYTGGEKPTDVEMRNLADAFIFDHKLPDGITPFEYFLENAKLSSRDRLIFERLFKKNVFGVFEVLAVYRNEGLKMKDLVRDKEYWIKERRGTHQLVPGYTVICRIAPFKSDFVITTPAPRFASQNASYSVKRELKRSGSDALEKITAFDLADLEKFENEFEEDEYQDKSLDEIMKLFGKKLNALGIKINFRYLDRRINENKTPMEAFPEVFEFNYPSNEVFEETRKLLFELWNKYPRKESGGKSPYEADLMGPLERRMFHDLMSESQRNINPDDYGSVEGAQNAINKFRDKWLKTPQKELDGKTPGEAILEERKALGNPDKNVGLKIEITRTRDYDENKAEKLYHEGIKRFKQGEFSEAVECFREVVGMYPENYKAWGNLGNCFAGLGRKKKAIECYKKALSLKPDYEFARKNLELIKGKSEEELAATGMPGRSFRENIGKILRKITKK